MRSFPACLTLPRNCPRGSLLGRLTAALNNGSFLIRSPFRCRGGVYDPSLRQENSNFAENASAGVRRSGKNGGQIPRLKSHRLEIWEGLRFPACGGICLQIHVTIPSCTSNATLNVRIRIHAVDVRCFVVFRNGNIADIIILLRLEIFRLITDARTFLLLMNYSSNFLAD